MEAALNSFAYLELLLRLTHPYAIGKCANHTNKRPFVLTANEALVDTLMTIANVSDIFPVQCLAILCTIKLGQTKLKLLEKKKVKETVQNQERNHTVLQ